MAALFLFCFLTAFLTLSLFVTNETRTDISCFFSPPFFSLVLFFSLENFLITLIDNSVQKESSNETNAKRKAQTKLTGWKSTEANAISERKMFVPRCEIPFFSLINPSSVNYDFLLSFRYNSNSRTRNSSTSDLTGQTRNLNSSFPRLVHFTY